MLYYVIFFFLKSHCLFASKPPRKKAKTQPTQSGQISSTTQFRATSQPTNGTGMRQQPRGPAQAMNGSGMQQSPRGPPPASPAVRPRTVADIDRDIAVRAVEVEKLQQEMTRLRWEKLMLEDCGQNGGAWFGFLHIHYAYIIVWLLVVLLDLEDWRRYFWITLS